MIDAATLQAFAAVCAMLLAGLVAICGWVYWHISGMERRMNARMDRIEDRMERMEARMERLEERVTQMERLEERMTGQMERMEQRLTDQMNRNHREILTLLEGHTHADGTPAAFRQLTRADG